MAKIQWVLANAIYQYQLMKENDESFILLGDEFKQDQLLDKNSEPELWALGQLIKYIEEEEETELRLTSQIPIKDLHKAMIVLKDEEGLNIELTGTGTKIKNLNNYMKEFTDNPYYIDNNTFNNGKERLYCRIKKMEHKIWFKNEFKDNL